jgi:hypothetical protein|tara:strand:+ start:9712 stop:9819 length:108 start_codon:yes stop_codon:yes gene_type:complete
MLSRRADATPTQGAAHAAARIAPADIPAVVSFLER